MKPINNLITKMLTSRNSILVIGDIMVDKFVYGNVNRLSPEATVPLLENPIEYYYLGGAANVCMMIHKLGMKVDLMGCIGCDEYGERLLELLKDNNISAKNIMKCPEMTTTLKTRYYSNTGHYLMRADYECFYEYQDTVNILDKLETMIPKYDIIILSDYDKGFLSTRLTKEIISLANKYKKKTIIDPKSDTIKKYDGCYIVKPNFFEFQKYYGKTTIKDIIENYDKVLNTLGVKRLLITCGENGILYLKQNETPFYQSASCCCSADVTGAGDVVTALLAVGLVCGLSDIESIELANKCAGLSVEKIGSSVIDLDDIKKVLPLSNKILANRNILPLLRLYYKNKKIVFTNGCFDLLHTGHLDLLQQAKQLGDILIVGLNSDLSIRKLKGERRPIYNENNRIAFLQLIPYVDWIFTFDDDDELLSLIEILCPNIIVKGEDYQDKPITGKDFVESIGGKLVFIPHQYKISTTNIIQQIELRSALHE